MSLFTKPPAEFPFTANVKERPAQYQIKSDPSDAIATLLLGVFWLIFGSAMIYLIVQEFFADAPESAALGNWITFGLCAAFIAFVLWYIFPEVRSSFRTLDVEITNNDVSVSVKSPFGSQAWSDPLTVYEGVANLDHGMQDLGGRKAIIGSVVLKHPDPEKSVPLAIREQTKLGKKTVSRFAKQLGVPALEGVGDATGDKALPEGTLLVNTGKSLILKLFYWGCLVAAAVVGAITIYQVFAAGGDAELLILPVFFGFTAWLLRMFSSCYVTAMREWQGDVWLRCDAISNFEYRFKPEAIKSARRFEGKTGGASSRMGTGSSSQSTHTPWIAMGVEGRLIPFILDLQGDYVNEKAVYRLAKAG
ncbi:MAG: hypothetical protein RIC14_01380 [Filomicrobium sp.]